MKASYKRKELLKKRKRSLKTQALNSVELPQRKDKSQLDDNFWYVVHEENLMKPIIFNYPFIEEYFARKFCQEFLVGHRFNVLRGDKLISLGITHTTLGATIGKVRIGHNKKSNYKYNFAQGLKPERAKALRTQYRRNIRRLLIKLLRNENSQV